MLETAPPKENAPGQRRLLARTFPSLTLNTIVVSLPLANHASKSLAIDTRACVNGRILDSKETPRRAKGREEMPGGLSHAHRW
jgi:hypothetical protein